MSFTAVSFRLPSSHISRASRIPRKNGVSHNSSVSCEPVDAPTLACGQGTHHHFNFRARAVRVALFSVLPTAFRQRILPIFTPTTRGSRKGPLGLSLVCNDRLPRCELVTATANGEAGYTRVCLLKLKRSLSPLTHVLRRLRSFSQRKDQPDGIVSLCPDMYHESGVLACPAGM
jgi:hypothetical protein